MASEPTNMTFKNLILIFTAGLLLICTACGTATKTGTTQASQTPSSVKITPANVTLQQWATQEFTGHVYDQNGNEITSLDPTLYSFDWVESDANGTLDAVTNLTEVDTSSPYSRTTSEFASLAGTEPLTLKVIRAAYGNNNQVELTGTTNVTVTSDPIAVVSLDGSSSNSLNWIITPQVVDASNGIVPLADIGVTALQWSCTYSSGLQLPPPCNPAWVDNGNQIPTGQVTIPKTSQGLGISIYAEYDGGSGGNVLSKTLVCNYATNQCQ